MIAVLALLGVYLNARRKWQGFLFWLVSNAWWCWHNVTIGEYPQAVLFAIFWLVTLYGIYQWRKKSITETEEANQQNMIRSRIIFLCRGILNTKQSLGHKPGRINITRLIIEARELLHLLGDKHEQLDNNNNNNHSFHISERDKSWQAKR